MHYYSFNIGDYRKDTIHLSRVEHGIYRDLIDWYYLEETPIPKETQSVIRRLRLDTEAEKTALWNVLNDFFVLAEDGYRQARIDQEIADYHAQCEKNKRNGTKGGRPKGKKTQSVSSGLPVASQTDATANPNQEPLTNNQVNTPIPPAGAEEVDQKKTAAIALPTWLDSVKAKGEKPIPENDPVFAYAEQAGIPPEHLRLCWKEFRERYSQPGSKKYKDWRSVFRKAVRGNWFKLWWVDGNGEYSLTTVGKQAERLAA